MRVILFCLLLSVFGACTPPSSQDRRALLDSLNQEKMYALRPEYTLHVLDSLALDSPALYHLVRGKCLLKLRQFPDAEQALMLAEHMSGTDSLVWADAHMALSHIYVFREHYQLGLKHTAKALSFSRLPTSMKTKLNGTLGLISLGLKNDTLAVRYFHQALIGKEALETAFLARVYNNLGNIYCQSHQVRNLDSALFYTQKAIDMKQSLEDRFSLLGSKTNLAEVYLYQGHTNQALGLLQEVLQQEDSLGDNLVRMSTYQALAETHQALRNFPEAMQYARLCADLSLKNKSWELHLKALKTQALIALQEQNVQEAEKALEAFDSARKEYIAETQARLQEDIEREKETALKQQENQHLQLQAEKTRHQKLVLQVQVFALALGIIILGYLSYGMYQRYRARIKTQYARQEVMQGQINMAKEKEQEALQKLTQTGKEQIRLREMMQEIQEGFGKIKQANHMDGSNLEQTIVRANEMLHDQDLFLQHMHQTQAEFFATLHLKFPALTETELRMCGLLSLELSSKEIAALLNIEPKSVDTFRYRIRKKLHLSADDNLVKLLKTYALSST